jgi:hypothetical protein
MLCAVFLLCFPLSYFISNHKHNIVDIYLFCNYFFSFFCFFFYYNDDNNITITITTRRVAPRCCTPPPPRATSPSWRASSSAASAYTARTAWATRPCTGSPAQAARRRSSCCLTRAAILMQSTRYVCNLFCTLYSVVALHCLSAEYFCLRYCYMCFLRNNSACVQFECVDDIVGLHADLAALPP